MLALAAMAGSAFANTAANTAIVNSAKLTFTGGSANATVTVTVALVPAPERYHLVWDRRLHGA